VTRNLFSIILLKRFHIENSWAKLTDRKCLSLDVKYLLVWSSFFIYVHDRCSQTNSQ